MLVAVANSGRVSPEDEVTDDSKGTSSPVLVVAEMRTDGEVVSELSFTEITPSWSL